MEDLTGRVFERLTVVRFVGRGKFNRDMWECVCVCGNKRVVTGLSLRTENTKSCGCYQKDAARKAKTTHGSSYDRTYLSWSHMINRCLCVTCAGYANYGAKGISVCARWREDYDAFLADMGERPHKDFSLDRIDPTKGYFPDNCRWADKKTQARNTRRGLVANINGVTKSIHEWAEITGINAGTIYSRIYAYKWQPEIAVTTKALYSKKIGRTSAMTDAELTFRDMLSKEFAISDDYVGIDFEFRGSSSKHYDLVACVVGEEKFWLFHDESEKDRLRQYLSSIKSKVFICYSTAEPECFLSLGLDPTEFRWVDARVEFTMCRNESAPSLWGRQLQITKSSKRFRDSEIPRSKMKDLDEDERKEFYATRSNKLLVALAKYCYDEFDMTLAEQKESVIPLIITGSEKDLEINKDRILNYCYDDVRLLRKLLSRLMAYQRHLYLEHYHNCEEDVLANAEKRGYVSALYAVMRESGIPVHKRWAVTLGEGAGDIVALIAKETNECLRDFVNDLPDDKQAFKKAKQDGFVHFDPKKRTWSSGRGLVMDELLEKHYEELCAAIGKEWPRSEKTNKVSTDKKYVDKLLENSELKKPFEKALAFGSKTSVLRKIDLKGDTQFKEVCEETWTEDVEEMNDLQWDSKSFWGGISKDDFCSRAPMFHYSTQSGRAAPSTTGCPILLPKFMRTILQPFEGQVILDCDYSSEEWLIAAIWAEDDAMLDAYLSGDIYLAFAKQAGIVPPEATKKTHAVERQASKGLCLGKIFGLGRNAMEGHLSNFVGQKEYTALIERLGREGMRTDFSDLFDETYSDLTRARKAFMNDKSAIVVQPFRKWTMWADNPNPLSKANCPIQGLGADILYEAVARLHKAKFELRWSLHDAIAVTCPIETWREHAMRMCQIMLGAFDDVCKAWSTWERIAQGTGIRASFDVWGFGLPCSEGELAKGIELRTSPCFVDPRGVSDTLAYGETAFGNDFWKYVLPVCEMHNPKLVDKWRQSLDYWHYALSVL